MARAIADTSVLLYLYRVESLNFLNLLFEEVWVPNAPLIDRLMTVGMWLSEDLRQRILVLAGETGA